jgi:hypothetical protein
MIEGKGLGGKQVCKLSVNLTNKVESDLRKLATACNMKPAALIREILTHSMYDSLVVSKLQDKYCTERAYRVRLVQKNGINNYALTGRDDL